MARKRSLAGLCLILALVYVSSVGAADGPPPAFHMPEASESVPRPSDLVPAGEPDAVETRLYSNARIEIEWYGTETVTHVYPIADGDAAEVLCPPGDIEPNSGSPPQISGTPSPGNVLTVSNGSWIVCGPFAVSYSHQWSTGTTGPSYSVQSTDVGKQINATVTACTSEDCAAATSNTVTVTDGGGGGPPPPPPPGGSSCSENDPSQLYSQFVSSTPVPTSVTVGQTFEVSISFTNAGQCTWTAADGYRLGSQNPENNSNWGFNRVYLATGESVAPGQTKTFILTAKAPSTSGSYGWGWRMVRELVNWFGPSTPYVTIDVQSNAPPPDYDTPGVEAEVEATSLKRTIYAGERCFTATWKDDKGSLFYYRKVSQRVEWCSKSGRITRYSTAEWPDNSVYCRPNWGPRSSVVAGGVGSSSVTIMTRGGFECDLGALGRWSDYVEVDVRYLYDGRREDA